MKNNWGGTALVVLIVVLAFKIFYLTPWGYIKGAFSTRDISLLLIWISFAWYIFSGAPLNRLRNPITFMIVFHLFMISVHISLANINYGQSLINGIIAARSQFIYVAFFLFVLLFDDAAKIVKTLDALGFIAVGVLFVSIINYFYPVVFHETWRSDEWEVYRGGIRRAFIPAMPLLNLGAIWFFCRWSRYKQNTIMVAGAALFLLGGHFFHQSRGQIWGLLIALLALAFITRKFRELGYVLVAGLIGGIVISVTLPENLLITPFTTTFKDIKEESGTIKGRVTQLEDDVDVFMDHPWIGSGAIALRASEAGDIKTENDTSLNSLVRKVDLGYSHWMKMYGSVGIVWLAALYLMLARQGLKNYRETDGVEKLVSLWALVFLVFIVVSGVTLNQFLVPEQILLTCLLPAVVVRVSQLRRLRPKETKFNVGGKYPHLMRNRHVSGNLAP